VACKNRLVTHGLRLWLAGSHISYTPKLLLSKLEDKVFLLCCGAETYFELFSSNSERKMQNTT